MIKSPIECAQECAEQHGLKMIKGFDNLYAISKEGVVHRYDTSQKYEDLFPLWPHVDNGKANLVVVRNGVVQANFVSIKSLTREAWQTKRQGVASKIVLSTEGGLLVVDSLRALATYIGVHHEAVRKALRKGSGKAVVKGHHIAYA